MPVRMSSSDVRGEIKNPTTQVSYIVSAPITPTLLTCPFAHALTIDSSMKVSSYDSTATTLGFDR